MTNIRGSTVAVNPVITSIVVNPSGFAGLAKMDDMAAIITADEYRFFNPNNPINRGMNTVMTPANSAVATVSGMIVFIYSGGRFAAIREMYSTIAITTNATRKRHLFLALEMFSLKKNVCIFNRMSFIFSLSPQ